MNISLLKTLVCIADQQSFQAASLTLGTSAANVSLQVKALEDDLGVRLFDRGFRPPRLTDAGIELVGRSRALIAQWEEFTASIRDRSIQGMLKVGAVHTAVSGGVSAALGRLHHKEPDLFLQLHTGLTPELISRLENHAIDCAVVTLSDRLYPELQTFEITREELCAIAHRESRGRCFQEVLTSNPYLRFNRQATLAQLIEAELDQREINVKASMEVTTLDALESLVKNGLGVSIIPVGKGQRRLPRTIRAVPFPAPSVFRSLVLMVRRNCPRAQLVNSLLGELRWVYRS